MTTDIHGLLKLAAAATPGPWKIVDRRVVRECGGFVNVVCECDPHNPAWYCDDEEDGCPDLAGEWARTLEYIAACSPQIIAALCRRIIKLEHAIEAIALASHTQLSTGSGDEDWSILSQIFGICNSIRPSEPMKKAQP